MLPLLLASASPRRRELLERVGVPLEVHPADVDEAPLEDEDPSAYVARIAYDKAIAVARRPGQWVLAADTTVTIDGKILAKAATADEAADMLRQLAGRVHQVITAFTILGDAFDEATHPAARTAAVPLHSRRDGVVASDVAVIDLTPAQIADYVASGEWRGKAGAYAIQGIGAALVREVRGSVTNVIGLPLVEVLEALRAVGAPSGTIRRRDPGMSEAATVAERWRAVRARVDAACERAGRDPGEVTIVAVSKTHPAAAVREAAAAGATDFGENYAQELVAKRAELGNEPAVRWHFIGRLQRNKAKLVAGQVALVHAVDTAELAAELGKRSAIVQPVLLAINAAGERTKGGVTAEQAPALARAIAATPNVRLEGLMTMPPPADDPEASRPYFVALRELRNRLAGELGQPLPVLSMGMSDDFEVAIACGATHVRIGTAIFGTRELTRT